MIALIRMVSLQGHSDLRKFREKKRSKRKIVTYRRERKRPDCFDDFSRYGNVSRLRGHFVASRASGADFSCDSLHRKSHEKQPFLRNTQEYE